MKKEYFWFFILILAAAIVTGSTLGIITNFKYISQQSKLLLQEQDAQESNNLNSHNDSQSAKGSLQPNTETNDTINKQSSTGLASNSVQTSTPDTTDMKISKAEKAEINTMLNTVVTKDNSDFDVKVKHFQSKNSLPSTGIVDSQTLALIIDQAKLQRAIQRLDN